MKKPRKPRRGKKPAVVLLALVVVAVAGAWWISGRRFQVIEGRWLRGDGGYIVEIRSVARDGTVDAAYFNPRSIHVAKAQASRDGDSVKLFVELRDVNYPGSKYDLRYDPTRDVLEGTYFQAVERQTYEVAFARQ